MNEPIDLPPGFKRIGDYIAEQERDPVIKAELDKARLELRKRLASVPYPEFCRHPDKCAGLGCCPREIACCD